MHRHAHTHADTHTQTCTHTHRCTHAHIHRQTHAHADVCAHMQTHMHRHTCTHAHADTCTHTHTHTHTRIHRQTHAHADTHTHTQTHSGLSLPYSLRGSRAMRTFAAEDGDLGERVVAAVALAANDAGLAAALASVHVARAAVGAMREAITRQAGVLPRGPVVILLQEPEAEAGRQTPQTTYTWRTFPEPRQGSRPAPWPPGCPPPTASRPAASGAPRVDRAGVSSRKTRPLSHLSKHSP